MYSQVNVFHKARIPVRNIISCIMFEIKLPSTALITKIVSLELSSRQQQQQQRKSVQKSHHRLFPVLSLESGDFSFPALCL